MEHAQDELEHALLDGVPDRSHAKHVGVVQQACWAVSCWFIRLGGVQKSSRMLVLRSWCVLL